MKVKKEIEREVIDKKKYWKLLGWLQDEDDDEEVKETLTLIEEIPLNDNHFLWPVESECYSIQNMSDSDKIKHFKTTRPKKKMIEKLFVKSDGLQKSTKA